MTDQRLHFFGGKGGAGKTTIASTFAISLADQLPKEKILLISSDASSSLSDVLKKKLSGKPQRLTTGKGEGGLFGAELEPHPALEAFIARCRPALLAAVQKGTHLSDEDLKKIFEQALPGLEELAGLLECVQKLEDKSFDRVVVDTAPTSHTVRLFDMPGALKRVLLLAKGGLDKKKKEPSEPSAVDGLIAELDRLMGWLKDPTRTHFHLVALAEPVAEAQTRNLFVQLKERGIPVNEVLVNLVEESQGCPACHGRRGLQAPHVRKFQQLDKNVPVKLIGRREAPPRGLDGLKPFGKDALNGKETKALEFAASEGPPALVRAPSMPPIAAPPLPPTRLIFFVGHGGVGKSSCAAAAAVTLTEKEGPVLLISTDPAHSLSDVLQSRLTDTETQVKGTKGLYARELDAQGWFAQLRKRWKEKAEKAFEGQGKGAEVSYDREVLRSLLDCAPPGVDELAALSTLTDALVQERFKRIVVDPTPSEHTVRVVDLAEGARVWLTAVHNVLVKHKAKGLGELADDVANMLKHVKRFEDALASPSESRFVVVTRGDELAASKTERLVEYLKAKKLAVERVLVNRVLPKSTCEKCENRRKDDLTFAKNLEKRLSLPITVAPALGRHPAGLRELKAFRTSWYALSDPAKIKAA